jgi:hypothetical protein
VAIEVFDPNIGDPATLAPQNEKLKQRFHLDQVVLITEARITETTKPSAWTGSPRYSCRQSRSC